MAIVPGSIQILTKSIAWYALNDPLLLKGQIGIEEDDLLTVPKYKIGDGVTLWSGLPYASDVSGAETLAQTLVLGNATMGTDIDVSSGDKITFYDPTIPEEWSMFASSSLFTFNSSNFGPVFTIDQFTFIDFWNTVRGSVFEANTGLQTTGYLKVLNLTFNGITFQADVASTNYTLTLPPTDSTGTQALVSNGSGILSWATIGAGTVTSVSGTTNRITSTGGAAPVIDIDSAYDALWQPINTNLTSLSGLTYVSGSFVKMTAAGTFALDTNTYLTTISGIAAGGELSGTYPNPTLVNSAVIGKVLTGYVSGAGVVAATDTILQAIQKLNGNIAAIPTGITGTLTATRIPYATGASALADSANLVWDNSNSQLSLLGAGTVGNPTIGIGQTDLGFYRPVADELGLVTGGAARFRYSSAAMNSVTTGSFSMRRAAGAAATPTYAFNGTVNTGMWLNGTDLAWSVAGVNNLSLTSGNILKLNNPANTFAYSITPSAIGSNLSLTLPLITVNDTLVSLALSQALTNKSVNGVTLVTGGTATKYLSEDGTYTTPAGGSGLTQQQVEGLI